MKRKRAQRWIAMLLSVTMLASTVGGTTLTVQASDGTAAEQERKEGTEAKAQPELVLPERVSGWTSGYEIIRTQEEADALRTQDETENLLIAAKDCALSGLKFGEIVATDTGSLKLSDLQAKRLQVDGTEELRLQSVELEQLVIQTADTQTVSLHVDEGTKIPEILLEGNGDIVIEGDGAFGMVRVTEALKKLTVRATCSVLNEATQAIPLETPEGSERTLSVGQQEELLLSAYPVTFFVDDQIYESSLIKPGETIRFPDQNPEKEGFVFTSWYQDADFTEACSQFAVAEGATNLYARFVKAEDAVTVTFDSMGGRELQPQTFAKGETLLTKPIDAIYTEKEGYTFGGWCADPECTTAFSYTEPLEASVTLYAFFVSDEAQEIQKDGTSADLKDFDWQGTIALRTDEAMTLEEVKNQVRVEAGSGELDPEIDVKETADGFVLAGAYYEKDGEYGFEPGATFSILVSGGVHFADYPDGTDTAVVSVYKEQVEIVGFSEDMTYVLWDDVLEYHPVTAADEDADETLETEGDSEETEEAITETVREDEASTEVQGDEDIADPDGTSAQEWEDAAYTPGKLLVKNTVDYAEGDIVAFYDGEIGRDEKNIDAYTEGDFDGYVLFAQILSVENTGDGVYLTYGYASPEDYLADFDVHVSDDVEMDQQLSEEDLQVLTSRLSTQIEENEELKAQMLVSVMTAPETQEMLDDLYGKGTYALAGMTADLRPGKPVIKLSVSGSEVTANISISATATIKKDGKVMLTVQPKLAFTQSLSVKTNVNGGKIWIDMSVTIRSMTKIELTVTATTGGRASVFSKAKDTLAEIVKPEGIQEGEYESYDQAVGDLMDTMNSIVSTSLKYNDLFDILLLNLKFSFYGIITVGFEVHLVGQVGVLATFGVEIVAHSGERIGFKYNFLKFKGSSYTEKLESSVTNQIYLIGKVGARVGLRLTLSVTMCGIASAYITGSLYAYAELTGLFFSTTNLLSGANTNLGALKFEVGIDVVVSLGLKVRLIFKTIRKNWTVYTGRWPLWSTSVSSKMSYMDEEELAKQWEKSSADADHKTMFGFENIPMKTWDLMGGKCLKNSLLGAKAFGRGVNVRLSIENLMVNGETIPEGDARNMLFATGDAAKGQNPGCIYMDEDIAEDLLCEEAELDVVVTYENNSASALVKKQTARFHLKKKCALATTTQNVKIVLNDWCARNWGLNTADWDNQVVYETSFSATHKLGGAYEPTATGTLNLGEIISQAQSAYPELAQYTLGWAEPSQAEAVMQYSVPQISSFCYMTPANGVVRYDVHPQTDTYDATYYLYVRRFEGNDDQIRYHIRLKGDYAEDTYAFSVTPSPYDGELTFTKEAEHTYVLNAHRTQFDGSNRPLMMAVNEEEAAKTGFSLNGRERQQDVYFDITIGTPLLGIQMGEGVKSYQFTDQNLQAEDGIRPGSRVELLAELEEGYGGLEVVCENPDIAFQVEGNKISFLMPTRDLAITLRACRLHRITYLYQYGGYGTYETACFTEKEVTRQVADPKIEGLTFRGWYQTMDGTGEPYSFGTQLQTDVTLYASWTCDVTVHFTPAKGRAAYLTGSEEAKEEHLFFENDTKEYFDFVYSTQRVGEKLLEIQIPEYEGYQFMDWYTDPEYKGSPVNLDTFELTGGVHLYARWAKLLTVQFDRNDGTEDSKYEEVTAYGGYPLPILPEDPKRNYYTFTGWHKNRAATDPFDVKTDLIMDDMILYADWKAVEYPIAYELNGGENAAENPDRYTTEQTVTLKAPTRNGYEFAGWTEGNSKEPIRQVTIPAGSGGERVYTAVWNPVVYSITYQRTYGTATENPTSYTIEDEEIVLVNPTREKYEFTGWLEDGDDTPVMEVHIPAGSTGDRVYTATWDSSDPVAKIQERIQVLAQTHPYEAELVTCLADQGPALDDPYKRIDLKVKEDAEAYLKSLIANDGTPGNYQAGEIGAYSEHIQIRIKSAQTDRTSDASKQIYQFELEAIYTDDAGIEHPVTIESYRAHLKKMIPDRFMAPEVPKGAYGQSLTEITDGTSLGEGEALYMNQELDYEQTASGTYRWKEPEAVPFGRNNGADAGDYAVIFTPDDQSREYFTPTETTVPVVTQTGLYVTAVADSRDYLYGDTTATGTATLVYADAAGNATEEAVDGADGLLTGGTWSFADTKVEKDKTVTFGGYSLDADKNADETYGKNAYVLVNPTATAKAEIRQVQQGSVQIVAPSVEKAPYPYGTKLGEVTFAAGSGSVTYQNGSSPITVEGIWKWNDSELEDVPDVLPAPKRTARFVPDKKYDGGFAEFTAEVSFAVAYKSVYIPEISSVYYSGLRQRAGLPENPDDYTVLANEGGVNAGEYDVALHLKDTTNYSWVRKWGSQESAVGQQDITLKFKINKAVPQLATTGTITPISYGQKLTATDDPGKEEVRGIQNVETRLPAKKMLNGYRITYPSVSEATAVDGIWRWVTTSGSDGELLTEKTGNVVKEVAQPLSVGKHWIKVAYTPHTNQANLETYEAFVEVEVQKAVPYTDPAGALTASSIYQGTSTGNRITQSKITADHVKVWNRYTGEDIDGTWKWTDETIIPQKSQSYSATFLPSDTGSYTSGLSKNCQLEVRTYRTVTYSITSDRISNGVSAGLVIGLLTPLHMNAGENSFTIRVNWNGGNSWESRLKMEFASTAVSWTREDGSKFTTTLHALGSNEVLTVALNGEDVIYTFKEGKAPTNDLTVKLAVKGVSTSIVSQDAKSMQAIEMESETDLPGATMPETPASEMTTEPSPESQTTQAETEPQTTVPETVTEPSPEPQTTQAETTTRSETEPQTTVPETVTGPETEPQTTVPETATQPATEPQTTAPERTVPETAAMPEPQTQATVSETAAVSE